ncbi:MAG: FlgD immunoglobulin-like domain containing protein [Gaiellaceae bacterium]
MARLALTALVVLLLAATAAAFALTQGLKLQKSPIFGTEVQPVFSPVCDCDKETATIAFKLRKADRLDVAIVDGDKVIRTIERGERHAKGPVEIEWDGRDDAGRVLPEGEYKPRIHVRSERQTITLPNPIRIDVTAPVLQNVRLRPRVLSPDGDGRRDRVTVSYTLNEPGRGALIVNGKRRGLGTLFARTEETIVWNGKADGRPVRAGLYSLLLVAFDPAGNRSARTPAVPVTVRYVALGRNRITVAAGASFAVRVSADAVRIRWTLGGRSGFTTPGTLRLVAPLQKGQFTLTVSANGHTARAAVFVREPPR